MQRVARGFCALVFGLSLTGGALAQTKSAWDDVVAAAKREGSVTVYHAQLGASHWKATVKAFREKYGIAVEEFDARASELTERIRTEQTSQRFIADLEFHGETTIILQRQTKFIAEHGPIPNVANLRPPFVADEWSVPAWVQSTCILVNTSLVPPADEPKSWNDLLNPKWKGKMLSDDMRAIGGGQTLFAVAWKTFGPEWLQKLKAQDLVWSRDLQLNSRRVARGEYPMFIEQVNAFASDLKGLPAKVIVPAEGCPYTLISGAILTGAPHPNAARLFINHLLDMDTQVIYGNAWMGTTIAGVEPKLADDQARTLATAKLMGTVKIEDRDIMLERATEMFK